MGSWRATMLACALLAAPAFGDDVVDEAKAAGKTVDDFPTHPTDLFAGMDGGIELTPDEIKGRNTWMMWTAGDEAFWDHAARYALGVVDLLKLCDNRFLARDRRLAWSGLINEPGMRAPTGPGPYGLWLDVPVEESADRPDPAVYGYSSGIIGLRIYPNPAFDERAAEEWDPVRYLYDERYSKRTELVRPYRVGMACSLCHVAFHPQFPPANPSEPEWGNLSALIGNQYWKPAHIISADRSPDDMNWQVMNSAPPGTMDTSIAATDGINNPVVINAIWQIGPRLEVAKVAPPETVSEGAAVSPELEGFPAGTERHVPRILMTGGDSAGTIASLARVWVNVGTFHQEWTRHFNLFVGMSEQTPFRVADAQKNSVYYQVTERRAVNLAKYFLAASKPMRLEDTRWEDELGNPHSGAELIDAKAAERGKTVFAENCFFCHSSKQPAEFWADPSDYDRWSADEAYLEWARAEVRKPDFRDDNFFSTDARHPVSRIGTNAARALADNAAAGNVWAEYSSETYKQLPPVQSISVQHPYTGETYAWSPGPRTAPGYYRPLSLVGVWATAPFLHNNSVGAYPPGHDLAKDQVPDLSVPGRLAVFEDSASKLLWPERRAGMGSIARTTTDARYRLPYGMLGGILKKQLGFKPPFMFDGHPWVLPLILAAIGVLILWRARSRKWWILAVPLVLVALATFAFERSIYTRGALELGHIPAGTPVSLLANLNGPGTLHDAEHQRLMRKALGDLRKVEKRHLSSLASDQVPDLVDTLLKANKVPDFVQDRGHLFGTALSDEDKRALIEFLKTL